MSKSILSSIAKSSLTSTIQKPRIVQRLLPTAPVAIAIVQRTISNNNRHPHQPHQHTRIHPPISSSYSSSSFSPYTVQSCTFSSSAASIDSPNPPPSRRKPSSPRKDPITITPSAAERIAYLLSTSPSGSSQNAIGIRLGTKKRGCNGLSYTLNYAYEIKPNEEVMISDYNGVKVLIEPMALLNVVGTTMDWKEDDMTSEFVFENPNSKGECGCGESFNV